jgi:hypothetical protein
MTGQTAANEADLRECVEVIKRYRATADYHWQQAERQLDKAKAQNTLVCDAIKDLRERFLALYPEGNVEQFFLESGIS